MTQDDTLAILKTGVNVFLTGEPGSGKTHTVKHYIQWLRVNRIEPAITASTGIAATHIGGRTIHSWSGIGIKNELSTVELNAIAKNSNVTKRVRATRVLIIDEVSMLSSHTLMMVDAVCRRIRDPYMPFGGLQVILVGDFFQLPPIVRRIEVEQRQLELVSLQKNNSPFAFSSQAWESLGLTTCYLSEQHRQEDQKFLGMLSAIRNGKVTHAHRALLQNLPAQAPREGLTQLFSHNSDVDYLNDSELAKLKGERHTFDMVCSGVGDLVSQLQRGCMSPEKLIVKVGARVMFTKNDVSHRYVNGTLGIVVGFSDEEGFPVVKMLAGRTIFCEPAEWSIEDASGVIARITQIPLRLAWAITVHKSQGMSLDAAHMDLTQVFEYGQGYVALSRVRTLAGLSLAGFNKMALQVHPDICAKDVEFRNNSLRAQESLTPLLRNKLEEKQQDFIMKCNGNRLKSAVKKSSVLKQNDDVQDFPLKTYSVEHIREKHVNAYRHWTEEEDRDLIQRFRKGEKASDIAKSLGRKNGAIHARLKKIMHPES